jgi:hypothetical protein
MLVSCNEAREIVEMCLMSDSEVDNCVKECELEAAQAYLTIN